MSKNAIQTAYGIALLYEQTKTLHLTRNFTPLDQDEALDHCCKTFHDKQIRATQRGATILDDKMNDQITIGLMLREMLEDTAEDELNIKFGHAASQQSPESIKAKALFNTKLDTFCTEHPDAAKIVNEIKNAQKATEDYIEDCVEKDSLDLMIMRTSTDYQNICALDHINSLERAHESISGQKMNEYNNYPLDGMSLELYVEDMNFMPKTDIPVKVAFVIAFNTYAGEIGLPLRVTPSQDASMPFAVIDVTPNAPAGPKF